MPVVEKQLPAMTVLSGPAETREECREALITAGLTVLEDGLDGRGQRTPFGDHGLPSHPNPELAAKAGVPNAGHTPGTPHPDTGEPYVEDQRVAFLTVEGERMDDAAGAAIEGWSYRMHSAGGVMAVEKMSTEERLARIECDLAKIRSGS